MALPTPFKADYHMQVLRADENFVATPKQGFDHLGALKKVGEDEGDFNDYCSAIRIVNDLCEQDQNLAEAIAVLMNRAHGLGLMQAASA